MYLVQAKEVTTAATQEKDQVTFLGAELLYESLCL